MKKWYLISSVIQLIIGFSAIISFIVLVANGENIGKWLITLILSVAFVVLGVIGIIQFKSQK